MDDKLCSLLTLIPWTLQRLVSGGYEVTVDANGVPQALEIDPEHHPVSTEEMAEFLRATLFASDPPRGEKLFALDEHPTSQRVAEALETIPLPPMWLARDELLHADRAHIVASVFWGYRRFIHDIVQGIVDSRIQLGGKMAREYAQLETGFQGLVPDALPAAVAEYVAMEMSQNYPAIVGRLKDFQVIPFSSVVPSTVREYARQAVRCYVYGFFPAALVLCRSCIETGVQTRLVQRGLQETLDDIRDSRVCEMLNLALNEGLLNGPMFRIANQIRRSANKAVHGTLPSETECREKVTQTRAVLRHLYELGAGAGRHGNIRHGIT